MEAIADAFLDIHDERPVPTIIRALDYCVEGDDDFHFNRKLVAALHRIWTKEAIDGIKLASHSAQELIRETADEFLVRQPPLSA